jgi:hypothetical protein
MGMKTFEIGALYRPATCSIRDGIWPGVSLFKWAGHIEQTTNHDGDFDCKCAANHTIRHSSDGLYELNLQLNSNQGPAVVKH